LLCVTQRSAVARCEGLGFLPVATTAMSARRSLFAEIRQDPCGQAARFRRERQRFVDAFDIEPLAFAEPLCHA